MMSLSKTLFIRGLQCHKSLWLYKYCKDLIPPTPPGQQAIYDEGARIGELARTYFTNGKLIAEDYSQIQKAIVSTKSAVKAGESTLFEAAVLSDQTLVRVDILNRSNGSVSKWDLIEVKGSTEQKDVHLPDLAVQYHVLQSAGFPVNRAY